MGAAHTTVFWKTNPALGRELGAFDLANRGFHEPAKFQALRFRDRSSQALDLGMVLSHEDHQRYFRDPRRPGIADQLGIECKQSRGFVGITTRCRKIQADGLPG
jgi:hypothetical protein